MSHVATVKCEITDLEALKEACVQLGMEFMEGQQKWAWYGKFMNDYAGADAAHLHGISPEEYGKCIHALRVKDNPNAYEVGLIKSKTNPKAFEILFDFWSGGKGLMAKIGPNASKLKQEYAIAVAAKQMRKQGFRVRREFNDVTQKPVLRATRRA